MDVSQQMCARRWGGKFFKLLSPARIFIYGGERSNVLASTTVSKASGELEFIIVMTDELRRSKIYRSIRQSFKVKALPV